MKSLEDEALEYAGIDPDELIDLSDERVPAAGHFIAGANSKWVQAEKIKAQVEVLEKVFNDRNGNVNNQIYTLRQQLKQLEDEIQ